MRRILSAFLSISVLLPNAYASEQWSLDVQRDFKIFQKFGAQAYLSALEKGLGASLDIEDKKFLLKTLSKAFTQHPPLLPLLKEEGGSVVLRSGKISAALSFKAGEENLWTVNGKLLSHKNKNIEGLTQEVWKLLSNDYNLGPYPVSGNSKTSYLWNLILPKAEAGVGTVLAVLVTAAVIGSMIYYVNKTTKATVKNINKVGDSVTRGVDRVTDSASNSIKKVGDSAANSLDKTGVLSDKAAASLDAVTETINSHKKE